MLIFEVIIALALAAAFVHFQLTKRKNYYQTSMLIQHINSSDEMKRTLAMGLYLRFKKENPDNLPNYSSIYIKQDPFTFESFVANVIQKSRGGSIWVSPGSGDFGVDFEHTTGQGLFLGQVKCYEGDQPFNPIVLIHSNMIKRGAVGGNVITTGSFTSSAYEYAEGLNIELIDGVKLVELWINGLENAEAEIKHFIPEFI
ncbi:restriction endonuclease [Neobacillus cucumis]|uniref:restriction endonuclease n=1 Tax=Neobacillus cucumis TaxID=1740721 RepID=UPI002E207EE7|nr:restriction endonuclease [Neobacillus cucumis]